MDGALSEQERVRLEEHLERCPSCRAAARQLEQLSAALAGLEEVPAPPELEERVLEAVKREKRRERERSRRGWVRGLAGLAACAVVCVGIYGAGLIPSGPAARDGDRSAVVTLSAQADTAAPEPANVYSGGGESGASEGQIAPFQAQGGSGPQIRVTDGGAASDKDTSRTVLTVERLPEGAAELLPPDTVVSHSVADGSETYSPLTLEQLQAISALAQEQGITASMSVPQGDGAAECLLVVLSGG